MSNLSPNRNLGMKHAGNMFLVSGMEAVTRALIMGDGFEDVEGLRELQRRAQALANAIEHRLKEIRE
jgi:hypothetical protein